ncbi:putative non-specific serine/threonine protein kinase [Helianthus annuus]|nr:putative non-specific serine/threonine protein kinase [Helianthus annuus]
MYGTVMQPYSMSLFDHVGTRDEAKFTTKSNSQTYKGNILDYMSGFDLSCNKLTCEIPHELGMLSQILALNLSHNQLTGHIPVNLSNLKNMESLDLSFNSLTGEVPPELIKLNSLAGLNVSYKNLSGRLPEMKAQLEKNCTTEPEMTHPSINEEVTHEKWYNMDIVSFYGSCGTTWLVFMLGFALLLYINPHWRRNWLDLVEETMFTCFYFLYDLVRRPSVLLCN